MINQVLEERKSRYGTFKDHSEISQSLQQVLWDSPNWDDMPLDTRQAMCVICDKMARALNGDAEYDDNFIDIIGYATLVLNRIHDDKKAEKMKVAVESLTTLEAMDNGPDYTKAKE